MIVEVLEKTVVTTEVENTDNTITSPQGSYSDSQKRLVILGGFGAAGGIVLFIVIWIVYKRCKKRRSKEEREISSTTTITSSSGPIYNLSSDVQLRTTEDVTRRYERSVSSQSMKSQIYLVPFDVLPPNFDFSSREVEVKADYVILKDLKLLERYNSNPSMGVVNEGYERQEPYNPYSFMDIPPLVRESYKKQEPYNPTYVY